MSFGGESVLDFGVLEAGTIAAVNWVLIFVPAGVCGMACSLAQPQSSGLRDATVLLRAREGGTLGEFYSVIRVFSNCCWW